MQSTATTVDQYIAELPPERKEVITELRKIIKNRGHFPNDDAAVKLLYLALKNITKDWKMSAREWKSAMNQFAILFADRFMPQLH